MSNMDNTAAPSISIKTASELPQTYGREYFKYNVFNQLSEYSNSESKKATYTYMPKGYRGSKNVNGSVTSMLNNSAVKSKEYEYNAFGSVESESNATAYNPWQYCGEYTDQESGLVYLRNRYYDPSTGRFINEDPVRSGGNWYSYCEGNPVAFWDPSGFEKLGTDVKEETYEKELKELLDAGVEKSEAEMSLKTTTDAITVVNEGIGITIYVYVNINGSGADKIIQSTQNIDGSGGVTYREAAIDGIVNGWSGKYENKEVNVVLMDVGDGNKHYTKDGQKFYDLSINSRAGIPNHSGWYAKNTIGKTNLYFADSRDGKNGLNFDYNTFSKIAAHEFGHALGISDAYNATSIKCEIPSIMYDSYKYGNAQAADYAMMLMASRTNEFQSWNRNLKLLSQMGIKYE